MFAKYKDENFQQYRNIYFLPDTSLLPSDFKSFRKITSSTYAIDSAHYYTGPLLSDNVFLKLVRILWSFRQMENF